MMDIEKLIEDLRGLLKQYGEKIPYGELVGAPWPYSRAGDLVWPDPEPYFIEQAATALSTLQAENEEMQKKLNEFSEFLCHMTGGMLSKTNYTAQAMISAAEGLEPPGKDNNVPTKEQNEPLTLDELREMDGEPVWVVPTGTHKKDEPMWCVLEGSMALIPGVDCWLWDFDGYGETWMAYRRPPGGEA